MTRTEGKPLSTFIDAGPLRMRLLHWPGLPQRPAFLLLHGLASNARFWELVGPILGGGGYPVWAPDLRGHGLTDKPEDGYEFASQCSDLLGLIQALHLERPILAGHSWGGMVALEYAARHSEGRWAPSGLALVDGGIGQLDDVPNASWESVEIALTPPRLEGTPLETFLARMEDHRRGFPLDERRRDIILANFQIRPDGTIAPNLTFDRHMRLVRAMWESPVYQNFERIRCPVLMVAAGAGDVRAVQAETYLSLKQRGIDQARRAIRDLRVEWIGTDHDIPLHQPEALAGLLSDLATRAGAASGLPTAGVSRDAAEVAEIHFRAATAKDMAAIRGLILRVGVNPRDLDWRRFLLAVDGRGRLVGCGQVKPHRDGSRELASIAVRRSMRKKGVASALIRRLMQDGGPPLWLMCRSGLVGFYKRFGFAAVEDPALMTRYFQRVYKLATIAGRLFPAENRLAVMVWEGGP